MCIVRHYIILIFDYTFPYVKDIENKYYEILLGMDPETIKNAIDGKLN